MHSISSQEALALYFTCDQTQTNNSSSATCGAGSLLYVPTSYLMLETAEGGPLCYGVRKSIFVNSVGEQYTSMIELMKADDRDVSKMKKIAECFAKSVEKS